MRTRHTLLIGAAVLMAYQLLAAEPSQAGSATLSWNANTEQDLAGYKLYRGTLTDCDTAAGPLQPLQNDQGQHVAVGIVTTYTDQTVPSGLTGPVCYEITAFNNLGQESPRSNRAAKNPPGAPTGLAVTSATP